MLQPRSCTVLAPLPRATPSHRSLCALGGLGAVGSQGAAPSSLSSPAPAQPRDKSVAKALCPPVCSQGFLRVTSPHCLAPASVPVSVTRTLPVTWRAVTMSSAETDRTLLKLLSWDLAQALGSLRGPGTHQRLSVSSPKSMSQLTPSLSAGRGAQPSSSCSPSPNSSLIHSSISLLFWKPSTQIIQRKTGFK